MGIKECQKFKIFFHHGDGYCFKIGQKGHDFGNLRVSKILFNHGKEYQLIICQKGLDFGHLIVKNSKFSSTMVINISLELVKKDLILGI